MALNEVSSLFCLLSVCVSVGQDSPLFVARARVQTSTLRLVTLTQVGGGLALFPH